MDPARIQVDTMGFADRFVTTMGGVYDEIERGTSASAVKDAAHQLKTDLALGAFSAAVNPRPIAGMIDMLVLVTLLRQIAEDPWTAELFGPHSAALIATLRREEADIRSMARRYLTDSQLKELSDLAKHWHENHPGDRAVSRVHLADLPEANRTPEQASKMPNSVMGLLFSDPTAGLDPAIREIELSRATSERMFFYLQRLPLLLQLQAESSYRLILETPELKQLLGDVSAASASTKDFAATGGRFTDAVEQLPRKLSEERHQAVVDIATEFERQRDATIRQIAGATAAEREAAIRQTSAAVASQRDLAIRQMAEAIHLEQQSLLTNIHSTIDRSINHLLMGLGLLSLAVVLFASLLIAANRWMNVHTARRSGAAELGPLERNGRPQYWFRNNARMALRYKVRHDKVSR
jgi:hypothetical protein